MAYYEVRFEVDGRFTYWVEADSPEAAYAKADRLPWSKAEFESHAITDHAVYPADQHDEVELDWERVEEEEGRLDRQEEADEVPTK